MGFARTSAVIGPVLPLPGPRFLSVQPSHGPRPVRLCRMVEVGLASLPVPFLRTRLPPPLPAWGTPALRLDERAPRPWRVFPPPSPNTKVGDIDPPGGHTRQKPPSCLLVDLKSQGKVQLSAFSRKNSKGRALRRQCSDRINTHCPLDTARG